MNTLKLLDDIRIRKLQPFFAPVLDKRAKVLSIQHDLPYWWDVQTFPQTWNDGRRTEPFPHYVSRGWHQFQPDIKTGNATVVPQEDIERLGLRRDFLNDLKKKMYVIPLFPIDEITWMVTPFNLSDASQRKWFDGKPRRMHLVNRNITSGRVVIAMMFGQELLFDEQANHMQQQIPPDAHAHANAIIQDRIDAIHKEQEEFKRKEKLQTAEGQMGASLEFMGATLKSWSKNLTGYNVSWELNGKEYSMEVDTNMRIDSAGVCLAGTDGWHSLSSIVAVMEERGR